MPLADARARLRDALDGEGRAGRAFGTFLTWLIVASAVVVALETVPELPALLASLLSQAEILIVAVFTLEYGARLFAAERPWRYAISFWGIVDLLAILPALLLLAPDWAVLRVLRLLRLLRILKLFRADRALARLARALHSCRGDLAVFGFIALCMTYLAAVGIYHFESAAQPDAFGSIPESLWWAIATLTTVGYGDVYPITTGGQIFTACILVVGLGVVAVPAGLVTAALLTEFQGDNENTSRGDQE
ncbi:potassium channel family protein [Jannaschia seohaensis]|uniref:Voltage-gated potassium channel n=1 Tax=Jannaschia seohaensis TaxID=475081 RepID=A0A2Y9A7S0_9RHOB|nr:ion transporter [Jannaschia seohaensis]PWJ21949.1 voltage-gated potassium channel [Jannaschia seohaensis]SSA38227.1 voltage-gated potassium channel [Jannaschia seohaensis]